MQKRQKRFILVSILFSLILSGGTPRVAQAAIQVTLESLVEGQFVSGILPITGWAFATSDEPDNTDPIPVTVELFIDGQSQGPIPCCVDRTDVQAVFGDAALNSGFGQVFNFGLLRGIGEMSEERAEEDPTPGQHTIRIEVTAEGVESQSIERTVTVVRPGGYEFLERPSLLGANSPDINEDQEIMFRNVTIRDPNSNETKTIELWLAWQPNIQQLVVVGSRTLSTQTDTPQPGLETPDPDDESAITAALENPPGQSASAQVTAGGIGVVSGWAFAENADAGIGRISLRIDGEAPEMLDDEIPCCSERADVQGVFPNAPLNTGFGGLVNFNRLPSGVRRIGIEIQDDADPPASRIIDHDVTVVRLGNAEVLDMFDMSGATVRLAGSLLILEDVVIREKGNTDTMTVDAGFLWNESCQCFPPWPLCGNGGRDIGEECDGTDFGELSCTTLGFGQGQLECLRDEVADQDFCLLDTRGCTGGSVASAAYVTLVEDNAVEVINTGTNEITHTIDVGDRPRGIAISPDGTEAYVTNAGDNSVSIIDTGTKSVVATVSVGDAPEGIAFAPDGSKAYVVNVEDNNLSVVDTATRVEETTIPVGRQPQNVAVMPDGSRAYVSNYEDNTVTVIDLTTNTPLPTPIYGRRGADRCCRQSGWNARLRRKFRSV